MNAIDAAWCVVLAMAAANLIFYYVLIWRDIRRKQKVNAMLGSVIKLSEQCSEMIDSFIAQAEQRKKLLATRQAGITMVDPAACPWCGDDDCTHIQCDNSCTHEGAEDGENSFR